MFNFSSIKSPIIFKGDENCAYRDPAVFYEKGKFYLFCTYVDNRNTGPFLTTVISTSENLVNWTTPRELTPRDKSMNFSCPENEETMFDFNTSIGIAWSDNLEDWKYPGM